MNPNPLIANPSVVNPSVANPLVIIPARMASQRLPGKPLAMIGGRPMIVHVWQQAIRAELGPVVVAAGEPEIAAAIWSVGGQAVLTSSHHRSGSDRVYEAAEQVDPKQQHDIIVNLQGDMPTIVPNLLHRAVEVLLLSGADIATLAAPIQTGSVQIESVQIESVQTGAAQTSSVQTESVSAASDEHWVKAVVEISGENKEGGRALYFTRACAPWGDGLLYHHIGIYAYRREALARFVALPHSVLEQRERLEQLRALANGMHIQVALVDVIPLGVDTHSELEQVRTLLEGVKV